MRTKSILFAAVLAASAIPAMADNVYSLNIVGYVNVPVQAKTFFLLANPLNASGGNNISNVLAGLPDTFDTTAVYTFSSGALHPVETFFGPDFHGWYPSETTLSPGQGFFLYPSTNSTITFVGEVQTTNSINLAKGYNLVGSTYPASLTLSALGLSAGHDTDTVYRWKTAGGFNLITFFNQPPDFVGWVDDAYNDGGSTNGPAPAVGEGFYYFNSGTALTWSQNFTVQ